MLLRRIIDYLFSVLPINGRLINAVVIVINQTRRQHFVWLFALGLLLHAHMSLAQFNESIHQHTTGSDSTQGYWRLNTQAETRSTVIQFFGADRQLLYEEILPGKWVKLSRKNQKQFDRLLGQLVANQLLTSRIKTEALPATLPESTSPRLPAQLNITPNSTPSNDSYLVHAYVNTSGKLYLIVDNPERLRYKIKVVDKSGSSLYEEFTNLNRYRRRLDLSALSYDAYQVVVQIDNRPFIYQVNRQTNKLAYSLQSLSAPNQPVVIEHNRAPTQHSFMPVSIDL